MGNGTAFIQMARQTASIVELAETAGLKFADIRHVQDQYLQLSASAPGGRVDEDVFARFMAQQVYGHPLEFRCEKPIMPTSSRTPIVPNGRTWHNGPQVMPSQHARVYFRFLKEEDGRVDAKDLLTGLILSQPHFAHTGWLWGEKLKLIFDWYKTRDELMAVADFAKIHRHLVQPGQHGPSELGDVLAKLGLHEASMLEEGTFVDAVESSKLRGTGTLLRPERQTLPRRQLRMISDLEIGYWREGPVKAALRRSFLEFDASNRPHTSKGRRSWINAVSPGGQVRPHPSEVRFTPPAGWHPGPLM